MGQGGVRLPLQGGLPPEGAVAQAVLRIACDESGFSGRNLLDLATPVMTHAGVDLGPQEAADLIRTLHVGGTAPEEVKSGRLLRGAAASGAVEQLAEGLAGRASLHLVDKEYFLATRVVDLFLFEPTYAAGTRLTQHQRPAAVALHSARSAGPAWNAFLAAFAGLVRVKRGRPPGPAAAQVFLDRRDVLARSGIAAPARDVLAALPPARVREVLTRLADGDRSVPPPLEPMLPALAGTVLVWSGEQREVLVTHDEQSALTADRLRRLQAALATGSPASGGRSPLAGLVMADSRDDPRVQVADLLAGAARRRPDLLDDGPLRPFLCPASLRAPREGS
jgi:hypothetical protein